MGFNKVYQCLMDIFPQVDSRILKAVAIENSKDVDAAAQIVLSEILPYLSKQTMAVCSPLENQRPRVKPNEDVDEEESNKLRHQKVLLGKRASSFTEPLLEPNEGVRGMQLTGAATTNVDSLQAPNAAATSKFHENNNTEAADIDTEELILLGKPESYETVKDKSSVNLNALGIKNSLPYANLEIKESDLSSKDQAICIKDGFVQSRHVPPVTSADDPTSILENTGEENALALLVPSSSQDQKPEGLRAAPHSESGSVELKSQQDSFSRMSDIEDDTFNPVSRSSQTCRIDLLEEIIVDAKNNKAMQSIMKLMREVELQEEAVEQAKKEAARGGLEILVKMEELKEMLPHAKESNDMHAGEIYGEKVILPTEMRELQSCLLSLSEERNKSLAILDEMRQTLKARQAVAEELMKTAEQEKLEKEESARNALTEQEATMAKVMQESKILWLEAEANSKLREFLMDRGQIVDSLQGEISVICEDVRLLKEKFDERIPLSKTISSSQTSCILASLGSSLRGMASDIDLEQGETTETLEKRSPTPSIDGQPQKSKASEERYKANDNKELLDDGWEILDGDAEF